MKRQFFLSTLFALISVCVFGQEKPFAAGFMIQSGYSAVTPRLLNNNKYTGDFSLGIGLSFNYKISKRWVLQSGISYTTLRDRYHEDQLRWGSEHNGQGGHEPDPNMPHEAIFKYSHYFVDLMVGMRYYANDGRFRAFVFPMVESNFYLSNRYETELLLEDVPLQNDPLLENNTTPFREVNFTAGLGIGLEAALSQQIKLIVMPSFEYMLLSMSKDAVVDNPPRFYNISARLGLEYWF